MKAGLNPNIARLLGIDITRDVEFGLGGGRPLRTHILRPKRQMQPLPCVLFINGGAWRKGSKDDMLLPLALLSRAGFVGAAIEYRPSTEAPFPAQIEDCKCAVRFLRANAERYGIDPGRIGAFGPSAGGHLAALLGVAPDRPELEGCGGWPEQSSRVQAVADWFGPTDLVALAGGDEGGDIGKLLGGPVSERLELAAQANPITYASKDAPPFLILHGVDDVIVPLSQSVMLREALYKAGTRPKLVVVPGKGHEMLGYSAALQTLLFFRRELIQG